jgi:hypothetical protein
MHGTVPSVFHASLRTHQQLNFVFCENELILSMCIFRLGKYVDVFIDIMTGKRRKPTGRQIKGTCK